MCIQQQNKKHNKQIIINLKIINLQDSDFKRTKHTERPMSTLKWSMTKRNMIPFGKHIFEGTGETKYLQHSEV